MTAAVGAPPPTLPAARGAGLTARARAGSAALAAGCLAVLLIAAWLEPAPAGHGTHTQLFMAPCAWPYFFGVPCPTCGMTTAFAHAADGHLAASFAAQPFGSLLAVGAAVGFWGGAIAAATGSPIGRFLGIMTRPRVLWVVVALAAAAWGYKIVTWPGL